MQLTPQKIIWVKQPFLKEKGEFIRVAKDFTPHVSPHRVYDQAVRNNIKALMDFYGEANVVPLTSMIWRRLENTDSWKTKTPGDVMKAIERNKMSSGMRDVSVIIDEFNSGMVRAPVVMQHTNGYTLVAGNTRLMVARASEIIPKVVLVRTDW
jgi:hypothetical protein